MTLEYDADVLLLVAVLCQFSRSQCDCYAEQPQPEQRHCPA